LDKRWFARWKENGSSRYKPERDIKATTSNRP
jgi:hypothetical protein